MIAKDLLRIRAQRQRSSLVNANLGGVKNAATRVVAQSKMVQAIGTSAPVMQKMNASIPRVQAQLAAYQSQSMKMEMNLEMSTARSLLVFVVDDALLGSDAEEAEADIYDQILDDVGLEFRQSVLRPYIDCVRLHLFLCKSRPRKRQTSRSTSSMPLLKPKNSTHKSYDCYVFACLLCNLL